MRGFQLWSIQIANSLGDGQIPVNYPTRPLAAKRRTKIMDKEAWTGTLGISSSFFTNLEGGGLFDFGAEAMSERNASMSSGDVGGKGLPLWRVQPWGKWGFEINWNLIKPQSVFF